MFYWWLRIRHLWDLSSLRWVTNRRRWERSVIWTLWSEKLPERKRKEIEKKKRKEHAFWNKGINHSLNSRGLYIRSSIMLVTSQISLKFYWNPKNIVFPQNLWQIILKPYDNLIAWLYCYLYHRPTMNLIFRLCIIHNSLIIICGTS